MTLHNIAFTPEFVAHLGLMGVRGAPIGGFPAHAETMFEAPVDLRGAYVWNTPIAVGAFTYLGEESHLEHVRIGRYSSIGKRAQVGLSTHPTGWLTTSALGFMPFPAFETYFMDDDPAWQRALPVGDNPPETTHIGNDVWIGANAMVKQGVTIGDGAVIGAMSVVTRDVPPYAVVAGTPARLIRMRFPDAVIERMLALRWWQYNLLDLAIDHTDPMQALDAIEAAIEAGLQPYAPEPMNLAAEARSFRKAQRRLLRAA
ncbi:CatB-related O-acetyltransferase [Sphingomonas sp. R-74633]|uniref:CatB-related O-acetyltransferase n=1 Tax=Sphingomonas sp. R-74633 TaxID=2751188 RepID=UPI0015D13D5B|nr:CatB-related O-acetyltransferase [Sphingomonas sp. R-74633]NYT40621.1 CatB-related O-acetyltransferase [Sphingomonas sp. R-74633]